MTKHNLNTAEDHTNKNKDQPDAPVFDVTSGGFLHIQTEELINSEAAKRQIAAVERLRKQKPVKEEK